MPEKFESVKQKQENIKESAPKVELFHVSGFKEFAEKEEGDSLLLEPGPQGAEGNGVYFSEHAPRFKAAEGAQKQGVAAVIVIEADSTAGWWRSKGYVTKKFGRPRTWHSDEKDIRLTVKKAELIDGVKYLHCDWDWENMPEE